MKKLCKFILLSSLVLMLFGCTSTKQTIAQQLAGTYESENDELTLYASDDDEDSGKVEQLRSDTTYYGTYTIYEESKTIVLSMDYGYITKRTVKLDYDLENSTLSYSNDDDPIIFEKTTK